MWILCLVSVTYTHLNPQIFQFDTSIIYKIDMMCQSKTHRSAILIRHIQCIFQTMSGFRFLRFYALIKSIPKVKKYPFRDTFYIDKENRGNVKTALVPSGSSMALKCPVIKRWNAPSMSFWKILDRSSRKYLVSVTSLG